MPLKFLDYPEKLQQRLGNWLNKKEQNLLVGQHLKSETPFYKLPQDRLITFIYGYCLILVFSFLVLLLFDFFFTQRIARYKQSFDSYEQEILSKTGVRFSARSLFKRIENYKSAITQKNGYSDKVAFTLSILDPSTFSTISIDENEFNVTLSGRSAIYYSSLILRFLESEEISQIYLRSAQLDPKLRGTYIVVLRGEFAK
jgi:hypothetical protein